jgi:hypothetical protein
VPRIKPGHVDREGTIPVGRRLARQSWAVHPRTSRRAGYLRVMVEQPHALGPVDFSTHVLSLASTALIALGKMPGPDGQSHPLDLETARHLIDVLAMLEHKTRGNLDEPEQKLLASLVYDLRVAYVDAQKATSG